MYNINQIEASLKYGKTQSVHKQQIIKSLLRMLAILNSLLFFIGLITIILDVLNIDECIILIFSIIFSILILLILLYIYDKNKKRNIEINKWLEDAVECRARAKRLDFEDRKYQPYQIEISFVYKDKRFKKISNKFNIIRDGLPKIFAKYHNKTLKILYSVKFDEILILKETAL